METILIDENQLNEKYSQDINRLKLALADYSSKLFDTLGIDMTKIAHDFIEPQ